MGTLCGKLGEDLSTLGGTLDNTGNTRGDWRGGETLSPLTMRRDPGVEGNPLGDVFGRSGTHGEK